MTKKPTDEGLDPVTLSRELEPNDDVKNHKHGGRSSSQLPKLLAVLPIPISLLLLGALSVSNIRGVFEPPWLLPLLNTAFLSAIPFVIAYVTTRAYLGSGSMGLLMLSSGVLTLGLSGFAAGILRTGMGGANTNVTIFNCGVLLAAVFHFYGAAYGLSGVEPEIDPRRKKMNVINAYLAVFILIGLLVIATVKNLTPLFFIQGVGPTLSRQIVLGGGIGLFAVSAFLLTILYLRSKANFLYWYSLALFLIAIGLACVFFQKAVGSPIGWLGRSAQYLGGIYLLVAVLSAVRGVRGRGVILEIGDASFFQHHLEKLVQKRTEELASVNKNLKAEIEERKRVEEALKKARDELEQRVEERTSELVREIEERKQAEEALHVAQERFSKAFRANPDPMTISRMADGTIIEVNEIWEEAFGYSRAESVGTSSISLGIWDDPANRQKAIQQLQETSSLRNFEIDLRCKTGEVRHVILSAECIEIGGEQCLITIVHDITERKQAEEALGKSEFKYRSLVESIPQKIFLKDRDSVYLSCNRSYAADLGIDPEEILGKDDFMFYPRELAEKYRADDKKIMGAGKIETIEERYVIKGEERWVRTTKVPLSREYGETYAIFGIFEDITERKRMEEELLRSQKLEAVGILAGGIAHDFNNILTTILGNVSMAKNQVTPEDELLDLLNEAETASTRAQKLTKQLLTLAKGGAPVKETASIKNIIKESSLFILRGSKSSCEFSIAEDLWPAEVDIGQMSQVINNIVINATQAMPEGGIIQVAADNLIIDDGHGLPVKPGRYIRISITDQGVGIAEKHLSKVFDPYFTTKHAGSGLGLATTYAIIKKHDGHITVESELEVGTTFYIYLPASDKAVLETEEVKLITGKGRILMMDDEASLKKMVGRMLEKLGYESEFAKDGAEAIQMYKEAKESGKPFDAVILDLTIPGGMGGKNTVKKLLEIDPEVKAIVSSGYSDDPVLANFQDYGFKGMMPKPFESLSLSKVLHEVLKGD